MAARHTSRNDLGADLCRGVMFGSILGQNRRSIHLRQLAFRAERHPTHLSSLAFPTVESLHGSVETDWRFSLWLEVAQARDSMHVWFWFLASCTQRVRCKERSGPSSEAEAERYHDV